METQKNEKAEIQTVDETQTVGETYRQMDNAALADYFSTHHVCAECDAYADHCDSEAKIETCRQRWLDHLNQKAELK